MKGGPEQGSRTLGPGLTAARVAQAVPWEQRASLFPQVGQGQGTPGRHRGPKPCPQRPPDLTPDHTWNKMQSPQPSTAPADRPPGTHPVPLCSCYTWPLAGVVVWGRGQVSPHHRAFALAGHLLCTVAPHPSGLSVNVNSPHRSKSKWSKCPLLPHIPL